MSQPKHLLIRSKDRNFGGSTSNFVVNLPDAIYNLEGISLLSVSLSNTIYNVTTLNNKIYYTDTSGSYVTTLVPGSYNILTLKNALQLQMSADSGNTYTVEYSSISMKLTFTCNLPFSILGNEINSMNYIIGTSEALDTPTALSNEMSNVVRLDFPSFLHIIINEVPEKKSYSTNNISSNFLCVLQQNSQSLEIFNRNVTYNLNNCYEGRNLTRLSIRILKDEIDLNETDLLNGADISILLGLVYHDQM